MQNRNSFYAKTLGAIRSTLRMNKTYTINLNSNDESNEFLRCLWSRLRVNFGKIAWNLQPMKFSQKNHIQIGYIDLGNVSHKSMPTGVNCTYSKKGCLKNLIFSNSKLIDENKFLDSLDKSILEAKKHETHKRKFSFITEFDKLIKFKKSEFKHFTIENNEFKFTIKAYDNIDAETFANSQMRFVNSILSFDTLKFINSKDSGISAVRSINSKEIQFTNLDTGENSSHHTSNEFKDLEVSIEIGNYIDLFLSQSLSYSDNLNSFEKSIIFFSEGLFFEELYNTSYSLDFNSIEYSITAYMSALELITIHDIDSKKCDTCKQETFSISKRIIELSKKANQDNDYIKKFVTNYYVARSKFVHTGHLTSSYNYIGNSIPLLSINSKNGIINQRNYDTYNLKFIVKELIQFHEKSNKDCT